MNADRGCQQTQRQMGPPAQRNRSNACSDHVNGSFNDPKAICRLAARCDDLTVEIEHVNTDVFKNLPNGTEIGDDWRLMKATRVEVQPRWRTIRVIQD